MKNKIKILLGVFIVVLGIAGCELDVSNPNSPTNEDIKTYDGIRMTAIGMEARLSQAIGDLNTVSGAVSGETCPVIGYVDYESLRKFPNNGSRLKLDDANGYCVTVWADQYKVMKSASDILGNIGAIQMNDTLKKNITAFAELGKSMAMYNLITHFEKIPIKIDVDHPTFADRAAVITEALNLLTDAQSNISNGIVTTFTSSIISSGWDLANSIKAYKARFYLMKGEYANAAAAAASVTAESQFSYTATTSNPLYENFVRSLFSEPLASWVRGPVGFTGFDNSRIAQGDKRVTALVDTSTFTTGKIGNDSVYYVSGINLTATTPYKFYTLNEMSLIVAESYARGGGDAATYVNKVRAAAGLSAYSGSNILREIFVQRYYELFGMAQHWEDLRRFKNDNIDIVNYQRATQLAHEWLVYPYTEDGTNPNCPAQPTDINYGL
jgi:starch-binding outer membrane protein, SusD/RagB family